MEIYKKKILDIAEKSAALVEKQIDATEELEAGNLHDIYESIQLLGHITATLERFSRMEN